MEELQVLERWKENRYPTSLPVPIGVREGSKPVFLNIHDKIEKRAWSTLQWLAQQDQEKVK